MKLLSSYRKELVIAARGFYFFLEFIIAGIVLAVLLIFVPEQPSSLTEEYLYYDAPESVVQAWNEAAAEEGRSRQLDDEEFTLDPAIITYYERETRTPTTVEFTESDVAHTRVYESLDPDTGLVESTQYVAESFDDMLRLASSERSVGGVVSIDADGEAGYEYFLQGSESDKFVNLISMLHNQSVDDLVQAVDAQDVRTLGAVERLDFRQQFIPVIAVMLNAFMGIFIAVAYIALDKSEGVIDAIAVTPGRLWQYLVSKTLVVMTVALASSLIVTVPVMGTAAHYALFIPTLLAITFAATTIGLLIGSFFDDLTQAFGPILVVVLLVMLPVIGYFVPDFSPAWLDLVPSTHMLGALKETLLPTPDVGYVLATTGGFLALGAVLLALSIPRYRANLGR